MTKFPRFPLILRLLLPLLFFFSFNLSAQFAENHAIFVSPEISGGNYYGASSHINYVAYEKFSFQLGLSSHLRKPDSQPENYSSGFLGVLLFGAANPFDQLINVQAKAGRIYRINKSGTIRFNLMGGVAFTIIREPYNWRPVGGSFITENYAYDMQGYNTISFIINPRIEFPFTRFYGLSLSPLLMINKDRTFVGVGVGHMIGLLRGKKPWVKEEEN